MEKAIRLYDYFTYARFQCHYCLLIYYWSWKSSMFVYQNFQKGQEVMLVGALVFVKNHAYMMSISVSIINYIHIYHNFQDHSMSIINMLLIWIFQLRRKYLLIFYIYSMVVKDVLLFSVLQGWVHPFIETDTSIILV